MDIASFAAPMPLPQWQYDNILRQQQATAAQVNTPDLFAQSHKQLIENGQVRGAKPLPCAQLRLKIFTYTSLQTTVAYSYYFIVKPADKYDNFLLRWWHLDHQQVDTLTKVACALGTQHAWPILMKQESKGIIAANAGQLMREAEEISLELLVENEKGQKIPFGKKLANDWLNKYQVATTREEKELFYKNLKELFYTFRSLQEGNIQFTKEEFAPFQDTLGLSRTTIGILKQNKILPACVKPPIPSADVRRAPTRVPKWQTDPILQAKPSTSPTMNTSSTKSASLEGQQLSTEPTIKEESSHANASKDNSTQFVKQTPLQIESIESKEPQKHSQKPSKVRWRLLMLFAIAGVTLLYFVARSSKRKS